MRDILRGRNDQGLNTKIAKDVILEYSYQANLKSFLLNVCKQ